MERGKVLASQSPSPPRILVVGTGAIGGFYGGKLAQAGARVSAVCRSDYKVVCANGIHINSVWGDFLFKPERVVSDVSEYGPPPDYILVGLKVLPEIETAGMIKAVVGPDTVIVLVQNGVEIDQPVARVFPDNEIISGLAFICVTRTGPGRVEHIDFGRLVIGRFPAGNSDRAEGLAELFNNVNVPCEVTQDAVTARWRKLVWNAPFNPISVLGGGLDTKAMLDTPESVTLVRRIMEEVCRIAEAAGHPLPSEVVQQNIDGTRKMEPYKTSMLIDFEEGRPMEVEAILGDALRVARRHGVAAPHMETLYTLLKLVDRRTLQTR
ncbi:MAG: 2-dehydropantoate 2-reductase [Deltaproteobacteria bacterium]|nr:MAG: 2-dehydropantoate 2-reductase [Deltaproteobacteria bacterium]